MRKSKVKRKGYKQMKKGYFIRAYGYDCFIETNVQKRTKALALDFINKIQNTLNRFSNIDEKTIEYVQKNMLPAYCELKTLSNGRQYFDIFGDNFGGYGYFVDENKTIII